MAHILAHALAYARPHSYGPGTFFIPLDPPIVIAIVVGSLLLPLVLVIFIWRRMSGRAREAQRLLATGVPGQARVLAVQQGSIVLKTGVRRSLSLVLSLEVHVQGRAPYTIQTQKYVPELNLALFQQGAWLEVRVDPNDPNQLAVAGPGSPPTPHGVG